MGMNAVVIVENSRGISFEQFIRDLESDEWARCTFAPQAEPFDMWEEFEWEGKKYFSWLHTPRFRHLGLYEDDKPDAANDVQITFLKIMLAVEKFAGGPVRVGNDAFGYKLPRDDVAHDEEFFLPAELDGTLPGWRTAENMEPINPHLVF